MLEYFEQSGYIEIEKIEERTRDKAHKRTLNFINAFSAKGSPHKIIRSFDSSSRKYKSSIYYSYVGTADDCWNFYQALKYFCIASHIDFSSQAFNLREITNKAKIHHYAEHFH